MENLSFVQKVQELQVREAAVVFRGGDGCSYPCKELHRQNCSVPVPGLLPEAEQGAAPPLASALQLALHG